MTNCEAAGRATRKRAREMFEQGLLDPAGKRLMLEQDEIERKYELDPPALNALVEGRLLRREPRNESVFYEISHDRLTEAIAKNRKVRLPRWVWPTLTAGAVVMAVLMVMFAFTRVALDEASRARQEAERANGLLLGEDLVSRLREAGLGDALQQVLDRSDGNEPARVPTRALKLRHQGDIFRDRGTLDQARAKFMESLAVLDRVIGGSADPAPELIAEKARTLGRLGFLAVDAGELGQATKAYDQCVGLWRRVLAGPHGPQEALDAAESHGELASLRQRMGDTEAAENESAEALRIALSVWTATYNDIHISQRDVRFELGRAMQVYADAALIQSQVWGTSGEARAAHALARESMLMRPLSIQARKQLGTAGVMYGATTLADKSALPVELYLGSQQHFDALMQFDPGNLRMQREVAAVQVVIAQSVATCADAPACKATLPRGALDEAKISARESVGHFRWLAGLDQSNRSLRSDVAWGLQTRAGLLTTSGDAAAALPLIEEAIALSRESRVDPGDLRNSSNVIDLLHEKARAFERLGRPLDALAALDAALAEIERMPGTLPIVMLTKRNTIDSKAALLKRLKQTGEAARLESSLEQLDASMGKPWDKRKNRAHAFNEAGVQRSSEAVRLDGAAAKDMHRQALEQFAKAIAEYPYQPVYWGNLRRSHDAIAGIADKLDQSPLSGEVPGAASSAAPARHLEERQAALGGAFAAAYMARALSAAGDSKAWRELYESRRSLAKFLRDQGRTNEALPLVQQGVLDAREYARRQPRPPDALEFLRDAYAGLGLLRAESRNDGWEEDFRTALHYGQQFAALEPGAAEHQTWLGGFHRELGEHLQKSKRDVSAAEQFQLSARACSLALRLAGKAVEKRADAQACMDAVPQTR